MLASTPYGVFQMLPVNAPQAPNAFFTKQDVSAAPAPAPAPARVAATLPWRSRAAAHRVRCSLPPGRPAALRPALPAAHVTPARAFLPLCSSSRAPAPPPSADTEPERVRGLYVHRGGQH